MIVFLSFSIVSLYASICCCMSESLPAASSICRRIFSYAASNAFFSSKIAFFSSSFSAIWLRTLCSLSAKCSLLSPADRICSFKILICTSSLPRSSDAFDRFSRSRPISSSRRSISETTRSYSSLMPAKLSFALFRSACAISYLPVTSVSCCCILLFSRRNMLTSSVFISSFFFR